MKHGGYAVWQQENGLYHTLKSCKIVSQQKNIWKSEITMYKKTDENNSMWRLKALWKEQDWSANRQFKCATLDVNTTINQMPYSRATCIKKYRKNIIFSLQTFDLAELINYFFRNVKIVTLRSVNSYENWVNNNVLNSKIILNVYYTTFKEEQCT